MDELRKTGTPAEYEEARMLADIRCQHNTPSPNETDESLKSIGQLEENRGVKDPSFEWVEGPGAE